MIQRKQIIMIAAIITLCMVSNFSCSAAIFRVPSEHPTIGAGISAASAGDTVLVADGTYTGPGNKALIFSAKTVMSENGPQSCIIDCEGNGRGFTFDSCNRNTSLQGFWIKNGRVQSEGYEDIGSGISCYDASPTIMDCIITGCRTYDDDWAGAVSSYEGSPELINCLIVNNGDNGICGVFSYTKLKNCTVADNGEYGAWLYFETGMSLTNSIMRGGMAYCESWAIDSINSTTSDPNFASGPYGDYYLSSSSSCVDGGRDLSSEICIRGMCLDSLTTQQNQTPDQGIVDIGFHYRVSESYETPTPTQTPTPTTTATPNPEPFEGVEMILNKAIYTAGDAFKLRAFYGSGERDASAHLYILLEAGDIFLFWPEWTGEPMFETVEMTANDPSYRFILDFTWPEGDYGSVDGLRFWGALIEPDAMQVMGRIGMVEFGYR